MTANAKPSSDEDRTYYFVEHRLLTPHGGVGEWVPYGRYMHATLSGAMRAEEKNRKLYRGCEWRIATYARIKVIP